MTIGIRRTDPLTLRLRRARILFRAGKNRDGYFNSEDVLKQTAAAIDIFEESHPGARALFAFDNAKTHQARAPDALSARRLPKGMKMWTPASGVQMRDGTLPNGQPQPLYFANNHPDPNKAGKFKGMEVILRERGLFPAAGLRAECKGFKCPPGRSDCCCRRVLFLQPDFVSQHGMLQELVEGRGHAFIFYPKFHCELNFIEMVWGKSKYDYRMKPAPKTEAEMEKVVDASLDSVSLQHMQRYVFPSFCLTFANINSLKLCKPVRTLYRRVPTRAVGRASCVG